MIDRKFARLLWNWSTKLGLALIASAVGAIVVSVILWPGSNIGLGPLALLLEVVGSVFLALGCTFAISGGERPPN